ncbi:MAG: SusD/RagB family nutrient-binding outer membrane lipoprotein [Bacteroidales bacterium]|nr:SusD/RagB family nutrient-binding outer membrane lipoprotein [Bacteroidales bacterium]
MKINPFLLFATGALMLLGVSSCNTDNLKNLDIPRYMLVPENADMSMMFTDILIDYGRGDAGANAVRVYGGYTKYYATYSNLMLMGGLYQFDEGISNSPWGDYSGVLKSAITLEDYLVKKEDPAQVNNLAMTRIMRVAIMQRITDYYGNVPDTEAGQAYISGLFYPKYDEQSAIYKRMLETLDEAATSLNSAYQSTTWGTSASAKKARDIVYGGNITKWKKFAYSLMLRIAMRASDADPAMAKTYTEKAIAGGVITSNADNWKLSTEDGMASEKNPFSSWFEGVPSGDPERYVKLGKYFVDYLKANVDPRRKVIFGGRLNEDISKITATDMATYWRDASKWNWDLTQAEGMEHGTNANPFPSTAEYHHAYTSPNPFLFTLALPVTKMNAGEMLLLISEASLKGWSTGTTAEAAYAAGITASMEEMSGFPGLMASQKIAASEITGYIAAKPLGTGAAAKQRIAEEMWVHMYMNPVESWSNVRRMNLMLPDNSANAHMPVRNAYVADERSKNLDNMNAALTAMGISTSASREEEIASRMWWDTADNF